MPPAASSLTSEKVSGPQVRQFSVFLQNKVGALLEVVKILNENNIEVLALSIQDSSESSIARMIVSDPDAVAGLFALNEVAFGECDVLVVELPNGASDLARMLSSLLMGEVNIVFSYPLLTRPRGRSVLAVHVDDIDCATNVLLGERFAILTQTDLSR